MPITTRGYPEISRKLGNLQRFEKWATPAVKEGVAAMKKEAKTYAPPVPGSKYVRTGRLKNSMEELTRSTGSGIVGTVYSTGAKAPHGGNYEHFVKVAGHQTAVHAAHGWQTDVQDLEKAMPAIDKALDRAVKAVLR